MKLWGRTFGVFLFLFGLTGAEPPLDPTPVCQAARNWKDFDGQAVTLIGRYSFRQSGPRQGRWLDQAACSGSEGFESVRLVLDPGTAPRLAGQIALDERAIDAKLAVIREKTSLGKFRFGSADYDRWAVVFGRFRRTGPQDMELVYRGDGAVFFLADR